MVILMLLVVLVSLAGAADTLTVTYQPIHGKDVTAAWPQPTQVQSFVVSFCSRAFTFFVEFTQLEELIGQNIEVHSAELGLWVDPAGDGKYRVEFCEEPWSSNTLTWYNQPKWSEDHALRNDPEFPRGELRGWETIDVTEYVQKWVAGTKPHYGFVVAHRNDDGFFSIMDSDYTALNESYKFPYLKVTYTPITTLVQGDDGGISFELPSTLNLDDRAVGVGRSSLIWGPVTLERLKGEGKTLDAILACSRATSNTAKENELETFLVEYVETHSDSCFMTFKSSITKLETSYVYAGALYAANLSSPDGSGVDNMHFMFLDPTNGDIYHLGVYSGGSYITKDEMIEIAESVRLP